MKTIRFNIHSGNGIISKAIKSLTNGNFSHTSIDFGTDRFEAIMLKGVVLNTPQEINYSPVVESYELKVTNNDYLELKLWAREQLGKGYDYSAILSFITPLFHKPVMGRWYCSELTYVLYAKAVGIDDIIGDYKISPQQFRDVLRFNRKVKRVI